MWQSLGQFAAVQAVAPSLGVDLTAVDVRDTGEIERAVTAFARSSIGGLIVTGNPLATRHRDLTIALAARLRLPAIYSFRSSRHWVVHCTCLLSAEKRT